MSIAESKKKKSNHPLSNSARGVERSVIKNTFTDLTGYIGLSASERRLIITPAEARLIAIAKGHSNLTILPILTGTVPDTVCWSRNLLLSKSKYNSKTIWVVTYRAALDPAAELFPVPTLQRALRFIQVKGYKDNASYDFRTVGLK